MANWEPKTCPKCEGDMKEIEGKKDAWRCPTCLLEVWGADNTPPERIAEEFADLLRPASTRELMSMALLGPVKRKGGSKCKRKRNSRRKPFSRNYILPDYIRKNKK
jgi:hypothetical protein